MKDLVLILLIVVLSQVGQGLLIIQNQDIDPLLFVLPFDLAMLAGLFWVIERPTKERKE